jgi:hypothetical protein
MENITTISYLRLESDFLIKSFENEENEKSKIFMS